jgi:hypothetical protein
MLTSGAVVQELIQDTETAGNAVVWTQKVLDCRRKYAAIVTDAFSSDRLFLQAMNQAFEVRAPSCAQRPLVPCLPVCTVLSQPHAVCTSLHFVSLCQRDCIDRTHHEAPA